MSANRLRLVRPDQSYREAFIRAAADYMSAGELEYAGNYAPALKDFSYFIQSLKDDEDLKKLKQGYVPQTWFWLVSEGGGDAGEVLGISRLRHGLSPALELEGGHIGYDVPPSMRKRGYGTILLRETLAEARKLGLTRVLMTVNADNPGSIRIIEQNGGEPAESVISPKSGKTNLRYWVEL